MNEQRMVENGRLEIGSDKKVKRGSVVYSEKGCAWTSPIIFFLTSLK